MFIYANEYKSLKLLGVTASMTHSSVSIHRSKKLPRELVEKEKKKFFSSKIHLKLEQKKKQAL